MLRSYWYSIVTLLVIIICYPATPEEHNPNKFNLHVVYAKTTTLTNSIENGKLNHQSKNLQKHSWSKPADHHGTLVHPVPGFPHPKGYMC